MPSEDLPTRCDCLVIGGGIAGASIAAGLAGAADVVLFEAESRPGYHTTGRSAAFFAESYGGATIRPLTRASRDFLESPPAEIAGRSLLGPRGCLHLFGPGEEAEGAACAEALARQVGDIRTIGREEALARLPMLRPERIAGAIDDPQCRDIDVAGLHQGYLRALARAGGHVVGDARVTGLRRADGRWRVETARGVLEADLVVNAAGAWADELAGLAGLAPFGFMPLRRTIVLFAPPGIAVDPSWPLAMDFAERFYFKPESGRILASPADETPSPPCDSQPEEIDIAILVDRLGQATTFDIPRIESRWAGLRTFAPDRVPVFGHDPRAPGFFWFAGQGGYGFQTAPAAAALATALALGRPVPDDLLSCGVRAGDYAPGRLIHGS